MVPVNKEQIVKEYANIVYGLAYRDTANQADAETVFSDVFAKYFKRDRVFENEQQRGEWFVRATTRCAKQLMERKGEK